MSILAGLALLAAGGEWLVRGSASVALRLGITPLVVGLTIVAFGTGAPELLVSVQAALTDHGGIALGNIVGSNISNIGLILGCAALVKPLRVCSVLLQREVPLMIMATLVLCAMLVDGTLSRLDGAFLFAGSIVYTVVAYRLARRAGVREDAAELAAAAPPPSRSRWRDAAFILGGLAALSIGARLLVGGATIMAGALGMSQVTIGLTVVAIGTSLPELAISVVAALRGEADIAFGNVVGSNILNILCILGLVALLRPISTEGLATSDVAVFAGSALVVLPLMWRGAVLNRWEGGFLATCYAVYLATLLNR